MPSCMWLLAAILVLLMMLSCTKKKKNYIESKPCIDFETSLEKETALGIETISGPEKGKVNQTVTFKITAMARNSCVACVYTKAILENTTLWLSANVYYLPEICLEALTPIEGEFSFTPTQAGTYWLKAESYEGETIMHRLIVE